MATASTRETLRFQTARRALGSRGSHHFSALAAFGVFAAGFLMRPAHSVDEEF
jgi:hypothetical protein